ncbi:DUF6049 family protein [Spongisporangium articulatum]|uniref:DUF6049 family protein n=1 Tax=Spongisporangium articulatum TaxID=3362603 RepID=A0ABW8AI17_9ACTN
MNPPRALRALPALALAIVLASAAGVPAGAGGTAGAGTAGAADLSGVPLVAGEVTLTLTRVAPAAVTADSDLTISGVVRNGTGKTIKGARASLRLHSEVLSTTADVQGWTGGTLDDTGGRSLPGTVKVGKLPAGGSDSFTVQVSGAELGLSNASWAFGPRGLTVEITAGAKTVAATRTTIVWSPTTTTAATRLTLLAPITAGQAGANAGGATTEAETELAAGGRLDRVVTATADPDFGWIVDPAVLSSAAELKADGLDPELTSATGPATSGGSGPASSGGSTGPSGGSNASATGLAGEDAAMRAGRQWLARFSGGAAGRTVLGLPYADPDINSLLNNKGVKLFRMAGDLGRRVTAETGLSPFDTTVAWPGDGRLPSRSVSAVQHSGYSAVLLASDTQPVDTASSTTTPTGRSTVSGGGESLAGLLYDKDLSTLVAGSGGTQSVQSVQSLLAELAAVSLEQPTEQRHLLAVTPRTWSPNPAGVSAMLAALHSAPWVELSSLDSLRDATPVGGRTETAYGADQRATELPPGQISRANRLKQRLDLFAPALRNPDPVLDPYRKLVCSLLSVAWRRDLNDLAAAGQRVSGQVGQLTNGVRLSIGARGKFFTATKSELQVAIINDTDQTLALKVVADASSRQLVVEDVAVEAPPGRKIVAIPAHALGSGNVTVTVVLENARDGIIQSPQQFTVKVRPDWETRGMIVVVSILGLLVVIGLLRGLRRSRTRVPPTDVPDVDDLAVQQAQDEARANQPPGARPPAVDAAPQPAPQPDPEPDPRPDLKSDLKSGPEPESGAESVGSTSRAGGGE